MANVWLKPYNSHMALQKITVNFTEKTSEALEEAARLSRDNRTDTINRAVQIYARLLREVLGPDGRPNGKTIAIHEDEPTKVTTHPDGTATISANYETINFLS